MNNKSLRSSGEQSYASHHLNALQSKAKTIIERRGHGDEECGCVIVCSCDLDARQFLVETSPCPGEEYKSRDSASSAT